MLEIHIQTLMAQNYFHSCAHFGEANVILSDSQLLQYVHTCQGLNVRKRIRATEKKKKKIFWGGVRILTFFSEKYYQSEVK